VFFARLATAEEYGGSIFRQSLASRVRARRASRPLKTGGERRAKWVDAEIERRREFGGNCAVISSAWWASLMPKIRQLGIKAEHPISVNSVASHSGARSYYCQVDFKIADCLTPPSVISIDRAIADSVGTTIRAP
jgi:hypothetical protein